jgi:hypothetical protein
MRAVSSIAICVSAGTSPSSVSISLQRPRSVKTSRAAV